jgi:glutaredoxin
MPPPRVLVYTKPGCHLCDDMLDLLHFALRGRGESVTERNIALDLDDFERYKHDIPVLVIDGREVARHRISEAALLAALDAAGLHRTEP